MKKLLLTALACLLAVPALADMPTPTPEPVYTPELTCTPAPVETPAPTRVPDMIAMPEGETRPIVTRTPRPTDAPLPADPFMANAIEIARRIDLLAKSETFLRYWDDSGVTDKQRRAITGGDHTDPVRVFRMSGEAMLEALAVGMPEGSSLPDLSRFEIRRDLVRSIPDMLQGSMDAKEVEFIEMLTRYKVFAGDAKGCGLMFMLYADATPIVLTWYADNGAVNIAAGFMPDETLAACMTAEDVMAWFAGKGMPAAVFEEVKWQ